MIKIVQGCNPAIVEKQVNEALALRYRVLEYHVTPTEFVDHSSCITVILEGPTEVKAQGSCGDRVLTTRDYATAS